MAVDAKDVAKIDVEPGELPQTMAAWVIREERQGEPEDAFQLEEIEVPEPGAFEVIVRVMAAGVNYNNVWAALGEPVGVWRYGDHPEFGHHIGGSDASGVVWKVGDGVDALEGRRRGHHPLQHGLLRGRRGHGRPDDRARRSGSGATRRPGAPSRSSRRSRPSSCIPKPKNLTWEEAASYGLVYFTAYRMLITRCNIQAGAKVLIWGAAGGLGVFASQICKAVGAQAVGVVSSEEKGELVKQLGCVDYINRDEFKGMMRTGGETAGGGEGALQGHARVRQARQGDPRRQARHRLRARRQGHVPDVGVHGQAVRQGRHLRRHHGLQPRLRRPLPVDAPEGDHRLALRQRVRVQQGQRADRAGPHPPGAVEDAAASTASARRTSSCATTSTRARSRSSSAPRRRASARPRTGPGAIYAEIG